MGGQKGPFAKMSKAKRIAALKKQLANRNTPKQFLPSIRERLRKLEN